MGGSLRGHAPRDCVREVLEALTRTGKRRARFVVFYLFLSLCFVFSFYFPFFKLSFPLFVIRLVRDEEVVNAMSKKGERFDGVVCVLGVDVTVGVVYSVGVGCVRGREAGVLVGSARSCKVPKVPPCLCRWEKIE